MPNSEQRSTQPATERPEGVGQVRGGPSPACEPELQFELALLDALAAHICVLDDSGVILKLNQAWRHFAEANGGAGERCNEGANYLQVCEQALRQSTQPEPTLNAFVAQLRSVLAGHLQEFQLEYPCHSHAIARWFSVRVARMVGAHPVRIVVAHDNITQLKLVQEALRAHESELMDLAASIPGAMFRLELRSTGDLHFHYFSPGVETLFGLGPEQACGDAGALLRVLTKQQRDAWRASLLQAVTTGRAWEYEFTIGTPGEQTKYVQAKALHKPVESGAWQLTGVMSDVSDRKQAEAELKTSTECFRTFFNTMPQGVVYHDLAGTITTANPAACKLLALRLDQLVGKNAFDPSWRAIHEDGSDFPAEQHPAMEVLRTAQAVHQVVMGVYLAEGRLIWLQVNATPLFKNGELSEVYASFEDITELVRTRQELQRQASTDHLTGAANRRHFMERLQAEYGRIKRRPDLCSCVVSLDLDHFKLINDGLGHAAGDAVLRHVTLLMRLGTRPLDVVGRIGGEEFGLILPDTGRDDALALAERLRERIEANPAQYRQTVVPVTVSIGISEILSADASAEAALTRSDHAMYGIKAKGRNGVKFA